MLQDEYFRNYCVVIVGDMLVGKTDIINRLLGKGYKCLIDVGQYSEKRIINTEEKGEFLISYNECPSGKSYEIHNENLYKIVEAFIITFDISDEDSFNNIDKYINLIKQKALKVSFIALVGNKIDLINKMKINDEDIFKKSEEIKKIFYGKRVIFRTISAKTNDGINELEIEIIEQAKKKLKKEKEKSEYSGFEVI
jgi:GTPase SAR1 family protein